MIKKMFKYFLPIILISAIIFSFTVCYADEESEMPVTTSDNASSETPEIMQDDLYLIDQDIVIDKFVNGNAYIMGNTVKIAGAINGNLFVLAKSLTVEKGAVINGSIFACAETIDFNGDVYDMYAVAADKLNMSIDSYVGRDLRISSRDIILKSQIDRNAYVFSSEKLDLGSGEDIPLILGNLDYSAKSEIQVPENVFPYKETSKVTFTPIVQSEEKNTVSSVSDIIWSFAISAVTAVVVALVVKFFFHTIDKKISEFNLTPSNIFKCFGIGLLILFCFLPVFLILLISGIGVKLGLLLLLIIISLCMVCGPLCIIFITNILKEKLNVESGFVYYLLIVLVSLILHAISLIPILGGLFSVFIISTTIGLFFKNSPKKIDNTETNYDV